MSIFQSQQRFNNNGETVSLTTNPAMLGMFADVHDTPEADNNSPVEQYRVPGATATERAQNIANLVRTGGATLSREPMVFIVPNGATGKEFALAVSAVFGVITLKGYDLRLTKMNQWRVDFTAPHMGEMVVDSVRKIAESERILMYRVREMLEY